MVYQIHYEEIEETWGEILYCWSAKVNIIEIIGEDEKRRKWRERECIFFKRSEFKETKKN